MFHDINCMLMGEKQHFYIFYKKTKLQKQLGRCVQNDKELTFLTTNFHEACYHLHRL